MAANMGISVEQFERHTRSLQTKGFMEVRRRFDTARGETLTQLDDRAFFRRIQELSTLDRPPADAGPGGRDQGVSETGARTEGPVARGGQAARGPARR